jgi:hypothetical protein
MSNIATTSQGHATQKSPLNPLRYRVTEKGLEKATWPHPKELLGPLLGVMVFAAICLRCNSVGLEMGMWLAFLSSVNSVRTRFSFTVGGSWNVLGNVWGMSVGHSGSNKSKAVRFMVESVRRAEYYLSANKGLTGTILVNSVSSRSSS